MKTYKFTMKIEAGDGGGAFVYFPFDVQKEFATRARVPVKATFDGVLYTGSLVNYGGPHHMLGVLKAIRKQLGKDAGDSIDVELWRDESERTVEVPDEFVSLLKKEGLLAVFEKLSYSHRREYCKWIVEAKKEETRARRMEKAIGMLRNGVKTPG